MHFNDVVQETCSRARKTALDLGLEFRCGTEVWQSATADDEAFARPSNIYKVTLELQLMACSPMCCVE